MRVLFAAAFALLGAGAAPLPRSSNVRSAVRSDDVLSRFRQLQAEVALLQVDDGERAQEVETVEQTVEQRAACDDDGADGDGDDDDEEKGVVRKLELSVIHVLSQMSDVSAGCCRSNAAAAWLPDACGCGRVAPAWPRGCSLAWFLIACGRRVAWRL